MKKEYQIQMRTLAEQNPAAVISPALMRKQTSQTHLSPLQYVHDTTFDILIAEETCKTLQCFYDKAFVDGFMASFYRHNPDTRSSLSPKGNRSNTPEPYLSRTPPKCESTRLQLTMPERISMEPRVCVLQFDIQQCFNK